MAGARKGRTGQVGVPLSRFRDSLPPGYGRAARLRTPRITASELRSNMRARQLPARSRGEGSQSEPVVDLDEEDVLGWPAEQRTRIGGEIDRTPREGGGAAAGPHQVERRAG